MPRLLSYEICFSRVLRHKADGWSCAQTSPLYKNAPAFAVSKSEKSYQLMLEVFFKSVILQTKMLFNKNEVIALEVEFACWLGLTDVTLHWDLHCRASFAADYEW